MSNDRTADVSPDRPSSRTSTRTRSTRPALAQVESWSGGVADPRIDIVPSGFDAVPGTKIGVTPPAFHEVNQLELGVAPGAGLHALQPRRSPDFFRRLDL